MTRSRIVPIVLVLGVAVLLSACAAGPNELLDTVNVATDREGRFLLGLWHGIIAPITFIISIFTDRVSLYEVHNAGGWYDFGFVLGAGILFGGGFFGMFRSGRRD